MHSGRRHIINQNTVKKKEVDKGIECEWGGHDDKLNSNKHHEYVGQEHPKQTA